MTDGCCKHILWYVCVFLYIYNKEVTVRGCDVPLWVQEISGSDDRLDQGAGPHRLLRRRLGAGVRLSALLVPHGFNVAAAPHSTARDLVILPIARVTPPIILRHLRWHRKGSGSSASVSERSCLWKDPQQTAVKHLPHNLRNSYYILAWERR